MQADAVAAAILDQAGQELAGITSAVRRTLFSPTEPVAAHTIGGVWASQRLRGRFQLLMELDGTTSVLPPTHQPAYGALLEAIRLASDPH